MSRGLRTNLGSEGGDGGENRGQEATEWWALQECENACPAEGLPRTHRGVFWGWGARQTNSKAFRLYFKVEYAGQANPVCERLAWVTAVPRPRLWDSHLGTQGLSDMGHLQQSGCLLCVCFTSHALLGRDLRGTAAENTPGPLS